MTFLFNACGANTPLIKEYDIAKNTDISAGEAVSIADNLIVKANDGDCILGVAAEDHSGKEDILNPRANGEKIRVQLTSHTVFSAKAPVYTASSGSATTLVTTSAGLSVNIKSGRAILIAKGENSVNTDIPGKSRRISACTLSGQTATLTLENGGTPCKGDVYMLIPDIGDELYLDAESKGVCFFNSASTIRLICACADIPAGTLGVAFKTSLLA